MPTSAADLRAHVAAATNVIDSATRLIQGLSQRLQQLKGQIEGANSKNDATGAVDQLIDELDQHTAGLAAAVQANSTGTAGSLDAGMTPDIPTDAVQQDRISRGLDPITGEPRQQPSPAPAGDAGSRSDFPLSNPNPAQQPNQATPPGALEPSQGASGSTAASTTSQPPEPRGDNGPVT